MNNFFEFLFFFIMFNVYHTADSLFIGYQRGNTNLNVKTSYKFLIEMYAAFGKTTTSNVHKNAGLPQST